MARTDQLWRALLKRLTSNVVDYVTWYNKEDTPTNDVIWNEVLSWWITNAQDIAPASQNQTKQSNIINSLSNAWNELVNTANRFNFWTYLNEWADMLSNLSYTIKNQTWAQTEQVTTTEPVEFEMPEMWTINTWDNALGINISQEEIDAAPEKEKEKLSLFDKIWLAINPFAVPSILSREVWESIWDWISNWDPVNDVKAYSNLAWAMWNWWESRWSTMMEWDIVNDYELDIQWAVQVYNAVREWQLPQQYYDNYLEEFYDKYDSYLNAWIEETWFSTKSDRLNTMKSDINDAIASNNYLRKAYDLKPEWRAEEEESTKQINTAVSLAMEKISDAVKYSNLGTNAQEYINDSYAVLQDWNSRAVRAMASARRTKANLLKYYWTSDTTQYSEEDRKTMEDISRAELAYKAFSNNLWDRIASYVKYADPVTWKIIIPDLVDWVNMHDAEFKWTDFLTNGDYWESLLLWKNNASAIDVLSTMSANIAFEYEMEHWNLLTKGWIWLQRWLRPVWELVSEASQQTLWNAWLWVYNVTSALVNWNNWWNYWRISFDALNEDNTLLSTLNTNNSQTWRLLQNYVAKFMEYTPEVVWNTIDTFWLASIPNKIRNATKFRVLLNNPVWWIKNWWKLEAVWRWELVWEWLQNLTASQRFWRFVASDAVPEIVWDQVIDATLSSADTDFGSNTSMVFSLWGTALWTVLVKMWEAWLFQMWKNGINMLKEAWQDAVIKTSWLDWTTYNMLNILDDENIDNLVKLQFNLSSGQLATWEELRRFSKDFKVVSNTVKAALWTLNWAQQREITTAVKEKLWAQLKNLINQAYWADSQFSRRITQLIKDDRTNPADVFKYALGINGSVEIWWRKSRISLADSSDVFVHWYNERLDVIPWISSTWFWKKLREWFTGDDLKNLSEAWVDWAKNRSKSWNFKKNNDRYYFTKQWLDNANDIRTSSLDVAILAKSTESAEEFDTMMRTAEIKKISDKTLQDIKDSWAYDTLADALSELEWLCWIRI